MLARLHRQQTLAFQANPQAAERIGRKCLVAARDDNHIDAIALQPDRQPQGNPRIPESGLIVRFPDAAHLHDHVQRITGRRPALAPQPQGKPGTDSRIGTDACRNRVPDTAED